MKQIRESKFSKIIAYYLIIMMVLQVIAPFQMYALTSGPTQPEFNSFTPIGTSDMVDLASGDFNYNISVMDVGGYPLNLAYNSGITMDQEASWVGLGWNLNVGQITRQVRGLPDDFNGDKMEYQNYLKDNVTVGLNLGANAALFGFDGLKGGFGIGVESNNMEGISFRPSFGVNFNLSEHVSVGMNLSGSSTEGATVKPNVSISASKHIKDGYGLKLGSSLSLSFNSRKGVENLNLSAAVSLQKFTKITNAATNAVSYEETGKPANLGGIGGSITFNNVSFTPSKRVSFLNRNFNFDAAFGVELNGPEVQLQLTGYGSYQKINPADINKLESAYGYEFTHQKNYQPGILDFNRENEKPVTRNTTSLPSTNYTYDLYSIDGQGISGSFRPYRSQVSHVYNDKIVDLGTGQNFGAELSMGSIFHTGASQASTFSSSSTGPWNATDSAPILNSFNESSKTKQALDYQTAVFKQIGSLTVDNEQKQLYEDKFHQNNAISFDVNNGNGILTNKLNVTKLGNYQTINSPIKRSKRFITNQVIQKVSNKDARNDEFIKHRSDVAHNDHTVGIKILQKDGTYYNYGQSVYNISKVEATFDVSGRNQNTDEIQKELITYNSNGNLGINNKNGTSDQYLNKITTPKYAHSYLLTSILSNDYEDVKNDGPTLDDLGSYTKFEYTTLPSSYKWRVPFQKDKATHNKGLNSKVDDQKGSYIYGEKELTYIDKIVTKTHVAFFDLEDRQDAIGVNGEHGGAGTSRMKRIKSIRLYSLPEVLVNNAVVDPAINGVVKPIKTAHFEYSYNLCKGIDNSLSGNGKLTLEKVYFTYRNSNMGKYTPYEFKYSEINPDYNNKGFDIWGNYKFPVTATQISGQATNTENPYVTQDEFYLTPDNNQINVANRNAKAWTLKTIELPSGGKINVEVESDDYQFVQRKKAMQMLEVKGAGNTMTPPPTISNVLYNGTAHNRFIYVKLPSNDTNTNNSQNFIKNYFSENLDLRKPILFRFLLNIKANNWQYEYVQGYLNVENFNEISFKMHNGEKIVSIPMQMLSKETSNKPPYVVNPISKTGWGFARTYLNHVAYSLTPKPNEIDFKNIVLSLVNSIGSVSTIFQGPNKVLEGKDCAKYFIPSKSWVRLENGIGRKYGGGLRVKSVKLSDNWSTMFENGEGTDLLDMQYGQEYNYDVDGKSSGVATFEPNESIENPFVEPFYNNSGSRAENLAAPKEQNYVEKPFGKQFFPSSRVTYSKVSVKNIKPVGSSGKVIKKHATGELITQNFTSYDFPTQVYHTEIDRYSYFPESDLLTSMINSFDVKERNTLIMSQGYSVITNDMDGKQRSETVYAEGKSGEDYISKVEYKYNTNTNGTLNSSLTTINPNGTVDNKLIGLDYDMIHDFNSSFSRTVRRGADVNLAVILNPLILVPPTPILYIPTAFPKNSLHENTMRYAVTTKHVHQTGILIEKIAYDLGSKVSTKNLAWDSQSGEVLLTKTSNEYNDDYYSFNYPAYWMYKGMGPAYQNIDITGTLEPFAAVNNPNPNSQVTLTPHFKIKGYNSDLTKYLHLGDELKIHGGFVQTSNINGIDLNREFKAWVVGFNPAKTGILLMDRNGVYLNKCLDINNMEFKIIRSGYRNNLSNNMASVTSMINPLKNNDTDPEFDILDLNALVYNSNSTFNPRIINASAVRYNNLWLPQKESNLPNYPTYDAAVETIAAGLIGRPTIPTIPTIPRNPVDQEGNPKYPYDLKMNPYVWNILGDWRAVESFAYLTGRKASTNEINNNRSQGFFTSFSPFYFVDANLKWNINQTNWTSASKITKISPYGPELENKDALNRFSAAQYGHQYKLPTAVASNSKYSQMGFESFEETLNYFKPHFGFDNNNSQISSKYAHTGNKSIKVQKNNNSFFSRILYHSDKTFSKAFCSSPTVDPNPSDYCPDRPDSNVLVFTGYTIASATIIGSGCHNNNCSFSVVSSNQISILPPTSNDGGTLRFTVNINSLNGTVNRTITIQVAFNPNGSWRYSCL